MCLNDREGKYIKKEEVYVRNIVPKVRHYNSTNTCKKIHHTGGWICQNCWNKDYEHNNINSRSNIIKSLCGRRSKEGLGLLSVLKMNGGRNLKIWFAYVSVKIERKLKEYTNFLRR